MKKIQIREVIDLIFEFKLDLLCIFRFHGNDIKDQESLTVFKSTQIQRISFVIYLKLKKKIQIRQRNLNFF